MFKKIHYARTSPSLALQLQQMPVTRRKLENEQPTLELYNGIRETT